LDHPGIKEMFEKLGSKSSSSVTARHHLDEFFDQEVKRIQDYMYQKPTFIQIDESRINDKSICAILVGNLEKPDKTFVCDVIEADEKLNYEFIVKSVKKVLDFYQIKSENFLLLLSDAAR